MMASLGLNIGILCLAIVQASGFVSIPAVAITVHFTHPFARGGTTLRPLCSTLGGEESLPFYTAEPRDAPETGDPHLKVFEFFSGIGGLRVSLEAATSSKTEIVSYDINAVANSVYEHNFPRSSVKRRSIEHLSVDDVDGGADVWLLSPPCQPFCRVGKQMDEADNRSLSFLHILSLLKTIENPPTRLFLENVRGFEGSQAHRRLLEVLTSRGFDIEQYLLSPVHLEVPNTRLRYYCLASRHGVKGEGTVGAVEESIPQVSSAMPCVTETLQQRDFSLRPLSEYLDPTLDGEAAAPLLLSPKAASHANPSLRFDVVTLRSTETTTFTKGYGKHAGRAGPVILLTEDGERRISDENLGRFPPGLDLGPEGRELRWFSDREMLRLHGFPEDFDFPAGLTLRQRFGLIGNSVNVKVVALLLKRMLSLGHTGLEELTEAPSDAGVAVKG